MPERLELEICILAGGLSTRMGRDKSRMRIGRRTMLGWVRRAADSTSLPPRILRRDLVPQSGPLGGIYTALKTTRAESVLFLPCDMPFVCKEILDALILHSKRQPYRAIFVRLNGKLGFPFLLPQTALNAVQSQIEQGTCSLQALARKLRARVIPAKRAWKPLLQNINTPEDLARARTAMSKLSFGLLSSLDIRD